LDLVPGIAHGFRRSHGRAGGGAALEDRIAERRTDAVDIKAPHGRRELGRSAVADRGYGEARVEDDLRDLGVRYVAVPRKGRTNAERRQVERRRAFRKMVRWRTGCEGRISCVKRDFGMNRTRMDGLAGARTWCGHGIFAQNLIKISGLIT
jgi:IS5 family transposase